MSRIKVMLVFGTRPEAIKMAPLVKALQRYPDDFEVKVLVTAQHREMLDQVLEIFSIKPDYDLNIMKQNQTLADITSQVLSGVTQILMSDRPDLLLVHGDTTTTFASALAAFYQQIKIGHVEAGLRSGNKYSPFPEEINRSLTGHLCDFHFAPTKGNRENLLLEHIDEKNIHVTGNTVIDALISVIDTQYMFENSVINQLDFENKKIVLMTAHRRENLGEPLRNIFKAVKKIAAEYKNVEIVYPMHLNPKVRQPAMEILGDCERIHLIEPLEYVPFANLMSRAHIILTDSGGIQEEAPALGKPVLVLRRETERPEAVQAGTVKVIGNQFEQVYESLKNLLDDPKAYQKMSNAVNPYGKGITAETIANLVRDIFN